MNKPDDPKTSKVSAEEKGFDLLRSEAFIKFWGMLRKIDQKKFEEITNDVNASRIDVIMNSPDETTRIQNEHNHHSYIRVLDYITLLPHGSDIESNLKTLANHNGIIEAYFAKEAKPKYVDPEFIDLMSAYYEILCAIGAKYSPAEYAIAMRRITQHEAELKELLQNTKAAPENKKENKKKETTPKPEVIDFVKAKSEEKPITAKEEEALTKFEIILEKLSLEKIDEISNEAMMSKIDAIMDAPDDVTSAEIVLCYDCYIREINRLKSIFSGMDTEKYLDLWAKEFVYNAYLAAKAKPVFVDSDFADLMPVLFDLISARAAKKFPVEYGAAMKEIEDHETAMKRKYDILNRTLNIEEDRIKREKDLEIAEAKAKEQKSAPKKPIIIEAPDNKADKPVKPEVDKVKKEERNDNDFIEKERLLFYKVLDTGGFLMFSTLPEDNSNFFTLYDERVSPDTITPVVSHKDPYFKDIEDLDKNERIPEYYSSKKLLKQVYKKQINIKKSFLGLKKEEQVEYVPTDKWEGVQHQELVSGGKNENCYEVIYSVGGEVSRGDYQTMDGRWGNILTIKMQLPESVALELDKAVIKNPRILRKLAEKVAIQKFNVSEEDWNKGTDRREGHPLRPPYELWQEYNNGKNRIYINDLNVIEDKPRPGINAIEQKRQNVIDY
ncbi:MAG: hypothetical protein NTZ49_01060 [Candidatus Parcubacteria bacterium]|nr:hypothetical protein [Candidatus Parcubacteria bacterium]